MVMTMHVQYTLYRDTDTDDETTELESRAQAASPAKYGASQSSSQQPPLQDENMPPQLPARKYKLKQDENRVGSAPSQSMASSNKITSTGRVNKNIEVNCSLLYTLYGIRLELR